MQWTLFPCRRATSRLPWAGAPPGKEASDLCSVVGVEGEEGALLGPRKQEGESILFIEVSYIVIFEIGVSIISIFSFSRV